MWAQQRIELDQARKMFSLVTLPGEEGERERVLVDLEQFGVTLELLAAFSAHIESAFLHLILPSFSFSISSCSVANRYFEPSSSSLPSLVAGLIAKCPDTIQKQLRHSIVLTGGCAGIQSPTLPLPPSPPLFLSPDFAKRFELELANLLDPLLGFAVRVSPQPQYDTIKGATNLALTSSFEKLCREHYFVV